MRCTGELTFNYNEHVMVFPVNYSNKIILHKNRCLGGKEVLHNILIGLQKEEASIVYNSANEVYFKGGLRFVSSANILLPISSGKIVIHEQGDEISATYKLKFTQLLVIVTGAVSLLLGPFLLTKTDLGKIETGCVLLFAWIWLVGANYLSTIIRFPSFLKKSIKTINR